MKKIFLINGAEIEVQDFKLVDDSVNFTLNGKSYHYLLISKDKSEMILDSGGRFKAAVGNPNNEGESIIMANGCEAIGSVAGRKIKRAAHHGSGLTSPMPGKIFKVIKEAGSEVKKGETILILEAMKMEHSIRSDKDGKVSKINYKVGELVQGGVTLAEVE
jgi:biotin carboxyl carrier protein